MATVALRTETELVRRALSLADPIGVLSVYVGARDAAIPGSPAMHEVVVELDRARRLVHESWVTDPGQALAALSVVERHVRRTSLRDEARDLAIFAAVARGRYRCSSREAGCRPGRSSGRGRMFVRSAARSTKRAPRDWCSSPGRGSSSTSGEPPLSPRSGRRACPSSRSPRSWARRMRTREERSTPLRDPRSSSSAISSSAVCGTPSGLLAAPGDVPLGATEAELVDDPMLADAMIGRALDTGASVLVLPERPGRLLGDDVAALLRF